MLIFKAKRQAGIHFCMYCYTPNTLKVVIKMSKVKNIELQAGKGVFLTTFHNLESQ